MTRRMDPVAGPRRPHRCSRAVSAGAMLTYVGAGFLLLVGLAMLLGTRNGDFFGVPTERVWLAGIPVAINAAPAVGAVFTVVAVVLVVLVVLTRRGSDGARVGLTMIGVVPIIWLLYAAITTDPISPWLPAVWIALAVTLLWVGRARETRTDLPILERVMRGSGQR